MSSTRDIKSAGASGNQIPFNAYNARAEGKPDQELMQSGPGTPLGEFFRRFWQPICLSEQVTALPLLVKILGEELVVFRDRSERVGLLNKHCSHRGASLEFGLVEERGLRCCYHGWLFDIDGRLLEAPGEPEHSPLLRKVCHGAYPAFEMSGLVFAYMGPPELKPQFPMSEAYERPGNEMVPMSNYFPCNWLQVQENIADPIHTAIFHNGIGNAQLRNGASSETTLPDAWSQYPVLDFRETQDGASMIYTATRRVGDNIWVRINHFSLPTNIDVGTLFSDGTQETAFQRISFNRWVVPHDDESCSIFGWRHFNDFVDEGKGDRTMLGVEGADFLGGQVGNRSYDEARENPGDWDVIVSQGKQPSHNLENLGTTDLGVAMWRRLVRRAIRRETTAALPAPMDGDNLFSSPRHSYCQDTVLKIPPLTDTEADRKVMKDVGKRVTDIVIEGDAFPPGPERDDSIKNNIKKLHNEFVAK